MNRTLAIVMLLAAAGCTSSTEYGRCIGAFDDKDPALTYKVSGWNVAMGVVFAELIVPPIVVLVDETLCPVGRKAPGPVTVDP